MSPPPDSYVAVARCDLLGWFAVAARGEKVQRLVFGHRSAGVAVAALDCGPADPHCVPPELEPLVRRLQAYGDGQVDTFCDVAVELEGLSQFARRVVAVCRQIAPGERISYAELARRAGRPGAARAAGGVMARNRLPLIVPCHRVVASDGRLGGFSAPGGLRTKRQLLEHEAGLLCAAGAGAGR